jgi:hypothetical protein
VRPRRLLLALLAVVIGSVLGGSALAAPAQAADPDAISIEGTGLSHAVTISEGAQRDLFHAVQRQIGWMATRPGDPIQPDPASLGAKYTVTVKSGTVPTEIYDVYPLAPGGPRAHRPAQQPGGKGPDAWFYASVAIPDMLRAAGVPLPEPSASNGVEYGDPAGYVPAAVTSTAPGMSLGKALAGQQRTVTVLAWLGTPLVVLLLIFPVARRSRRYSARQLGG